MLGRWSVFLVLKPGSVFGVGVEELMGGPFFMRSCRNVTETSGEVRKVSGEMYVWCAFSSVMWPGLSRL